MRPPKTDIAWRKPGEWAALSWPEDLDQAILLVHWKNGDIGLEAVYWLGDRLVLSAPPASFRTESPDPTKWLGFCVVETQRRRRKVTT